MKLYYEIWVDCITRMRSVESNKSNWKVKGIIFMSLAMTLNFVLIMVVLQREVLGFNFYEINLPSLTGFVNFVFTILLLYIFPCVFINYLLIFRNNKYEKLLIMYKYHNGKLCLTYYIISYFSPIVLLWIGVLWLG